MRFVHAVIPAYHYSLLVCIQRMEAPSPERLRESSEMARYLSLAYSYVQCNHGKLPMERGRNACNPSRPTLDENSNGKDRTKAKFERGMHYIV